MESNNHNNITWNQFNEMIKDMITRYEENHEYYEEIFREMLKLKNQIFITTIASYDEDTDRITKAKDLRFKIGEEISSNKKVLSIASDINKKLNQKKIEIQEEEIILIESIREFHIMNHIPKSLIHDITDKTHQMIKNLTAYIRIVDTLIQNGLQHIMRNYSL